MDVVTFVQTNNNNYTRSKFQADNTEVLEQSGINIIGVKQAQKLVQQVK